MQFKTAFCTIIYKELASKRSEFSIILSRAVPASLSCSNVKRVGHQFADNPPLQHSFQWAKPFPPDNKCHKNPPLGQNRESIVPPLCHKVL